LLPIQKNHFTQWQHYDENHRLPCKNRTSQRKKAGGNVTTHAQHRIIYILDLQVANTKTTGKKFYQYRSNFASFVCDWGRSFFSHDRRRL